MTGNSAFAGTVNVDGVFNVNSRDAERQRRWSAPAARSSGTGSVGNTTISGTLSPGNSPGTITMASLTLTTAATYLVQTSGTISDSVVVTGTANVAGTVVIDPADAADAANHLHHHDGGNAERHVQHGELSDGEQFRPQSRAELSRQQRFPDARSRPALPGPVGQCHGANQKNVAGAIDNALLGGSNMSNAFSAIFNLSGDNLLNGLTQLSGETATGSQQTTFNAMTQFLGIMTRSLHRRPRR